MSIGNWLNRGGSSPKKPDLLKSRGIFTQGGFMGPRLYHRKKSDPRAALLCDRRLERLFDPLFFPYCVVFYKKASFFLPRAPAREGLVRDARARDLAL